jgi:hypothetical protein
VFPFAAKCSKLQPCIAIAALCWLGATINFHPTLVQV